MKNKNLACSESSDHENLETKCATVCEVMETNEKLQKLCENTESAPLLNSEGAQCENEIDDGIEIKLVSSNTEEENEVFPVAENLQHMGFEDEFSSVADIEQYVTVEKKFSSNPEIQQHESVEEGFPSDGDNQHMPGIITNCEKESYLSEIVSSKEEHTVSELKEENLCDDPRIYDDSMTSYVKEKDLCETVFSICNDNEIPEVFNKEEHIVSEINPVNLCNVSKVYEDDTLISNVEEKNVNDVVPDIHNSDDILEILNKDEHTLSVLKTNNLLVSKIDDDDSVVSNVQEENLSEAESDIHKNGEVTLEAFNKDEHIVSRLKSDNSCNVPKIDNDDSLISIVEKKELCETVSDIHNNEAIPEIFNEEEHKVLGLKTDISCDVPNVEEEGSLVSEMKEKALCEAVPAIHNDDEIIPDNFSQLPDQLSTDDILKDISSDTSDPEDLVTYAVTKKDEADSEDNSGSMTELGCIQLLVPECEKKVINFSDKSLWEEQKVPALQIGSSIPKPMLSLEMAAFNPHLVKALNKVQFPGPSCIQSVMWPAMIRKRCLVAVAPPHAGKTIAYLLPLVDSFLDGAFLHLSGKIGPIVIILCSSWKKVQAVYDLISLFVDGESKLKILTVFADGGNRRNKITNMMNSCDILITTSFCLLQFFETNALSFSRCHHFILDDANNLMTYHRNELKQILLHFINCATKVKHIPQLVVCAERWDKGFNSVAEKLMKTPLLLFTSFLEAAIYAKVPIFAHVCDTSDKKMTLLSILEGCEKAVVCTTNLEDAMEVHNFLKYEVKSYLVHEKMEHYVSDEVTKDWKSAKSTVVSDCLVITDAALANMSVSIADCLIHYDVPKISRLQFGNRFGVIAEHFKSKDEELNCVCHVVITEESAPQAFDLLNIIKSIDGDVPSELRSMADKQIQLQALANPNAALCHYMKAFGLCKKSHCDQRHFINLPDDEPAAVLKEGDVQALVTHVFDACHYYVRVLKYILPRAEDFISLSAPYAEIGFKLKHFYSSVENKKYVDAPVVGSNYVLEVQDLFYRVKVLDTSVVNYIPKVKLLFIDEGWVKIYDNVKLYILPESLQLPPPLAIEVYLCNVSTPDSCWDWNPQASQFVSDVIKGKEIYGKVVLCIGGTLWLHPVVIREKLYFLNEYLNVLKLDTALKKSGHAVENKKHLNLLYKACEDKIPVPDIIANKRENFSVQTNVSYAFLELGVEEDVYVSSVISPHQLYVQRAKFVDCLDDLLNTINARAEKQLLTKCSTIYKGMHCIAPFREDNRYYRAVVTDVSSDDNIHLFFVDFGDTDTTSKCNIFILPPDLMLLPFQAVECELSGICAAHGGWTEEICNILYHLTRDNAGDMKILYLKAYSKTPCYGGGNHYTVDIWDDEKSLSEQLLQTGLVIPSEKSLPSDLFSENEPCEQIPDVPEGFYSSSSDEMHPDEKDAAALFCGVLSKLMLQSDKLSNSQEMATEIASEEETISPSKIPTLYTLHETRKKFICDNKISEVDVVGRENKSESSVIENNAQTIPKTIEPAAHSENMPECKPLIIWWDAAQVLHMTINLRDLKTYNLELYDEGFSFKTNLRGIYYSVEERFYSSVHSNEVKKIVTPRGLIIVLEKRESSKWPRFTESRGKFLHIKYDLEHLEDSDTETDPSSLQNVPAENSKENCIATSYVSDESSDSSTEEEEKYVQPWKELSEYKDPYNPLS